jgi:hypothetical protein
LSTVLISIKVSLDFRAFADHRGGALLFARSGILLSLVLADEAIQLCRFHLLYAFFRILVESAIIRLDALLSLALILPNEQSHFSGPEGRSLIAVWPPPLWFEFFVRQI